MLDMAVRTKVAEFMNSNIDIAEAFKRATETKELKLDHFAQNVTTDIATKKCTDCTAVGFGESHASGTKVSAAAVSTKDFLASTSATRRGVSSRKPSSGPRCRRTARRQPRSLGTLRVLRGARLRNH